MSRARTARKLYFACPQDGSWRNRISAGAFKWYLKKGLATQLSEHELRFDFTLSIPAHVLFVPPSHCCAICGQPEELSVHHVVPIVLRRGFSQAEKLSDNTWSVLLCPPHHALADAAAEAIWREEIDAAPEPPLIASRMGAARKLRRLMLNGQITRIPSSLRQELLEKAGLQELPDEQTLLQLFRGQQLRPRAYQKRKRQEKAARWLSLLGGAQIVKARFRAAFLNLNPRHLPEGSLRLDAHLPPPLLDA